MNNFYGSWRMGVLNSITKEMKKKKFRICFVFFFQRYFECNNNSTYTINQYSWNLPERRQNVLVNSPYFKSLTTFDIFLIFNIFLNPSSEQRVYIFVFFIVYSLFFFFRTLSRLFNFIYVNLLLMIL